MSLREVLIDELKDLYSAENQLVKSLPKTAKAVESSELEQIFLAHLNETKEQIQRLRRVFEILGKKPTGKHCKGMEGAIDEVKEAIEEDSEGASYDAGIIGGAARVEHYEIAGYSVSIALAKQLGEKEIVSLLTETLTEEQNTGKLIMNVAKTVFKQALDEEGDEDEPEEKPKTAKEKKSEADSKRDEADAKKDMGEPADHSEPAPAKKKKK